MCRNRFKVKIIIGNKQLNCIIRKGANIKWLPTTYIIKKAYIKILPTIN